MKTKHLTVTAESEGVRLDRALGDLLPEAGLRLRRRMCDEGLVTVNGRPAKPSLKLHEGMDIAVGEAEATTSSPDALGVYVVGIHDDLAAVFKPEGVHSAAIAGRDNASVEGGLDQLFPERSAVLLNRLDLPTSGIVAVALTEEVRRDYLKAEDAGQIEKDYVALVAGRFDGTVTVRLALDAENRKTTHVINDETPDDTRWTEVTAVSYDPDHDRTLVRCRIKKGARHQIRAHLATLGHPIVGDTRYGGPDADRLFLHHERLCALGHCFEVPASF